MNVNLSNADVDVNALLRQVAVLYPEVITWRQNRSYMLGQLTNVNEAESELSFEGYIKGNLLNVRRLIHITGMNPQAFRVKRIEIGKDPCPVKVSQKEKEKILSTSKAQSIMSSRKSSRRGSMDVSKSGHSSGLAQDNTNRVIQQIGQVIENEKDQEQCENKPSPFAAEQTWPTEEELKEAASRKRRVSGADEEDKSMQLVNPDSLPQMIGGFENIQKPPTGKTLEEMFDRMEIKVVGKETEEQKSDDEFEDDDEDDEEFDLNKTFMDDPNKISQKHQKYTDLESRAKEDMDFPDEVDTPMDVEARKRYMKYRGVKSIKNCDWDAYESLPQEYAKIWRFQSYTQAQKDSILQAIEEGLPLNGTFVRLVLEYDV